MIEHSLKLIKTIIVCVECIYLTSVSVLSISNIEYSMKDETHKICFI